MYEAPDHEVVEKLVSQWIQLSREKDEKQRDYLFRFVAIWIAFNALYEYHSQQRSDHTTAKGDWPKIENYIRTKALEQRHQNLMQNDDDYRIAVDVLAERIISDMSGERKPVYVGNRSNVAGVLKCIYRIRCNLFHGGKTPTDPRDNRLVRNAYEALFKLLEPESKGFRISE